MIDKELSCSPLRTYTCTLIEHTYKVKKFQITRLISNVITEDKEKDEEKKNRYGLVSIRHYRR